MARAMKTRSSNRGSAPRGAPAAVRPGASAWEIHRARGLQIVESPMLGQLDWLVHGFSSRPGGASELNGKPALNLGFTDWDDRARVAENRAKFATALDAGQMPL